MHIDPCCSPADEPGPAETTPALTRRRMLLAAGAGAGALVLRGVPAGAETASSDTTSPSSTTTTTTAPGSTTTTAPTTTTPGTTTTTTAPPTTTTPLPPPGPDSMEGTPDFPEGRDYGFLPPRPADEVHVRPMMFPVLGRVQWSDTYLAPRGGGRRHEGQDLMGAKMLKLLACVNGVIIELRHGSSGNSLYLKGDDGWYYCYLHINNDTPGTDDGANRYAQAFAPGISQGVRVKKGQHIAYVGDSGNAEGTGSHCHFEIRMPNARWYNAAAVNAKYSLDRAEAAREGLQVPPETFAPWSSADPFIRRQYRDLLGRTASAANLSHWGGQLNTGKRTPQSMMAYFAESAECDDKTHAVARLYQAFFLRRPDYDGFAYWTGRRRGGYPLTAIADAFARSPEFVDRYGRLSNEQFVDRIYQNVLGRWADPSGKQFWTQELDRGRSRGMVMVQFSNSPENRAKERWMMHVVVAYGCLLRRMPNDEEVFTWMGRLSKGQSSVEDMVNLIRLSDEYAFVIYVSS